MIRAVILLSLASRTAATSCCVCNGYPFDDKEDRLRLEFKASDRHSRGELHSSQI